MKLSNGVFSDFTLSQVLKSGNHVSYEGKGLTPDEGYEENFNKVDFFRGIDSRLGKAFEWIKDHR